MIVRALVVALGLLVGGSASAQSWPAPGPGRAASGGGGGGPTVDAIGHATPTSFPGTSLTWTHVNGGSADLILLMGCAGDNTLGSRDISAASYNSVAASSAAAQDDANFENAEIWLLASPATGSHTASLTLGSPNHAGGGSISFVGASATLRSASGATNTTANPAVTGITTVAGDVVVGIVCNDNEAGATTPAGTEIFDDEGVASDTDMNAQYVVATGTSTNLSWTNSGSGSGWVIAYVVVKP